MAMRTYNHKEVSCIVNGIDFKFENVDVGKLGDKNAVRQGANGEIARSVLSDELGFIRITGIQTNPQNKIMAGFAALNPTMVVMVRDNSGNSLYVMSTGVFLKDPDASYGQEAGDNVWEIQGEFETYLPGGN